MLLNRLALLSVLLITLGAGEIFDSDVIIIYPETAAPLQEAMGSEPQTNVSCGEYFDRYCLVRDANNPHCIYRKDKSGKGFAKMYMSPEIYKHCKICGIQQIYKRKAITNKIYGGTESMPHSWPWMAGLYESVTRRRHVHVPIRNKTYSKIICGASLISEKHAITATHCLLDSDNKKAFVRNRWYSVKDALSKKLFLRFGDHHRHDWSFEPQLDVSIRRFAINKSATKVFDGDVAIIELERPLNFTRAIHPVCLPPPNLVLEVSTKCMAVGWGLLNQFPPVPSPSLQETEMRIVSPSLCLSRVCKFRPGAHICAYEPEKGLLRGDYGGGLYCKIHPNDNQWYLYGVSSFSWLTTSVTGFSHVPHYANWIHQMIKRI
nr:serine protease-like [Hymenolepis microstoma]